MSLSLRECLVVKTNRIRRYERVWPAPSTTPDHVPTGFAIFSRAALPAAQQQAAQAQQSLYQWAYERARAEADAKFERDWTR